MALGASPSPADIPMRERANSNISDVVMSEPTDAESPTTDPSAYSDVQRDGIGDTEDTEIENAEPVSVKGLQESVAHSPLFRLPKELRLRIYTECLKSSFSILWPIDRLQLGLQPQLLRVCSTIAEEAAPILYSNMMHFFHPSDANMFLWAHNPILGKTVTKILFQIRDRDLKAFWSSYLSSRMQGRSLKFDYPNLRTLHIQFRSSWLHPVVDDMFTRFQHWEADKYLKELSSCLQGNVPDDCDVRVLSCSRIRYDDAKELYTRYTSDLEHVGEFGAGKTLILRTTWRKFPGANIAMEIEGC